MDEAILDLTDEEAEYALCLDREHFYEWLAERTTK